MAYAKLFSTITESSLWSASKDARLLFLSMLARADQVGFVEAALPGLARLANLTLSETESALAELMAPDPHSKTPDFRGSRVMKMDRGWCLVNYEFYREKQGDEDRRSYMRRYMKDRRCKQSVNSVSEKLAPLAHADADADVYAEAEAKNEKSAPAPDPDDIGTPPATPPPAGTDADAWRFGISMETWARTLAKACKIGPKNWPKWKELVDKHGLPVVESAAQSIPAKDRWPETVSDCLAKSRGQANPADVIAHRIHRITL